MSFVSTSQTDNASGMIRAWQILGIGAAVVLAFSLLAAVVISAALAGLIFFAGLVYICFEAFQLITAKSKVLSEKNVDLFHGLGRLVAWNPSEGVLFLESVSELMLSVPGGG